MKIIHRVTIRVRLAPLKNIPWRFRAAVLGGTGELRYDPGY